mmetsp:Transcript_14262/g.16582  ORF Transcript_14262/g.16582 Transcript_14262/m.16582 type:complete len:101 (+) Transcript_14262:473-775(+)
MMRLMQELKDNGFEDTYTKPKIRCKAFEDNTGALALATVPKIRPRTKHVNLVYHHFRSAVKNGDIEILPVESANQLGDIYTKPLAQNLFVNKFRKAIQDW